MKRISGASRTIVLALAVIAVAVSIAACGGSSAPAASTHKTTTTTASKSGAKSFTALRTCLSKHGVTLPKRSGSFRRGAGGFSGGTHTGTTPGGGYPGGGYWAAATRGAGPRRRVQLPAGVASSATAATPNSPRR